MLWLWNTKWLVYLRIHNVKWFLKSFCLSRILVDNVFHSKIFELVRCIMMMSRFFINRFHEILFTPALLFPILILICDFGLHRFFLLSTNFSIFFLNLTFQSRLLTKTLRSIHSILRLVIHSRCTLLMIIATTTAVVVNLFIVWQCLSYPWVILYAHWFEHLSHHNLFHFCAWHDFFILF